MKFGTKVSIFQTVISILGVILAAYIVRDLWGWFIVPLGLPRFGLAHALGLTGLLRFVTIQPPPVRVVLRLMHDEDREATKREKRFVVIYELTTHVVYPLFAYAGGYIGHLLM